MSKFRTSYMDSAVFNLPNVLEVAQEHLEDVDFDTIVGTGFSGGIVVPSLALAMDKKFVLVRKDNDDSHHKSSKLLGDLGSRWLFVDDFVSSGKSRLRVMNRVREAARQRPGDEFPMMVGQYTYEYPAEFQSYSPDWESLYW